MSGGDAERDLVAEEEERLRRSGLQPRRIRGQSRLDDGTKRLALTAGGLGVALVAVVGGWSLVGHRPHSIPVIEPPAGPIRIKPADAGGMQVSAATDSSADGGDTPTLAPPPEQAHPELLQAQIAAARRAEEAEAARGRPGPGTTAMGSTPASGGTSTATGPVAPAPAAVPAPSSSQVAGSPAAPAPMPAAATSSATAERAAVGGAVPNREDAAPAAPPSQPQAGDGGHAVQLAALDSDAAARGEWARLSRQAPALLERRAPMVVPVEKNGKRFFRLRTGGFDSVADATRFCGALRAKGIACALADF